MPIVIKNKEDCTGCSACQNICPKLCINMKPDKQGFVYPSIVTSMCIQCDLCVKVCPIHNQCDTSTYTHRVYAAWSKNENTRYTSTSGGAFSELAYRILEKGGVVAGAAYDNDNLVKHILVSDRLGIERIRQSKYIQSKVGNIYCLVKEQLEKGVAVLFCGAPCQVAGLKSYLKKEYLALYTVDFICRGMNSPKAYRFWLDELENKNNSKATKVWFKYKINGWKKSPYCTRVDFQNGDSYVANAEQNYFMQGYLQGNLYLRPSCSQCHFKGVERSSDITLADFWKVSAEFDDDKGTSLVMINSDKGADLFNEIQVSLYAYERNFQEITGGNVCFSDSVKLNPKGAEFLQKLGTKPFSVLVKEYTKISYFSKIKRKGKNLVKKILSR